MHVKKFKELLIIKKKCARSHFNVQNILRYLIGDFAGGSLLRIEPVRKKREGGRYECVAENGVGDEVSVHAELNVYDGENLWANETKKIRISANGGREVNLISQNKFLHNIQYCRMI